MSTITTQAFSTLQAQQYVNLTTFRKNGTPMATPVWFAQVEDRLYIMTVADSGKIKRIRNNGRVLIAPATSSGKQLGPEVEALARVLPAAEVQVARNALDDKYGLFKAVFDFFMTVRGVERAWVEVRPVGE